MLRLEAISVKIADTPILHNVSFSLRPGAATVLVGRNGAGKTTLLRTVMGLLKPISGKIFLDDNNVVDKPGHERTSLGLGYAPEDRRLISAFSIEENILLPLIALGKGKAEQKETLENIYDLLPQLKTLKDRPAGSVSGGQGKMVALGRALTTSDRLILLDEPFQGLAPALALDYAKTLKRLKQERSDMTFLITESSPDLLDAVADHEMFIERGTIDVSSSEAAKLADHNARPVC